MNFSAFRRHKPPTAHVYLFVCEDQLLVDESRQVWAGWFEGDWGFQQSTLKEFDAIPVSDLMELALTPPLFGPSRVMIVTQAGKLSKKRAAELQAIAALERSSLKVILVLSSRPGRGASGFPLIEIDPMKAGDTVRWMIDRFGLAGDVARYLVDHLGPDLLPLRQEIEKLQTYVGGDGAISIADVDQLTFRSEQFGPFELDDAFLERDYPKSVRVVGSMIEEGVEPILILSKLVRVWRQVFVAKALERRGSPAELSRAAGIPQWKAERFAASARRFDWERVVEGFGELVRADQAFKTSSPNAEYYLDVMMWKLIGEPTPVRAGVD